MEAGHQVEEDVWDQLGAPSGFCSERSAEFVARSCWENWDFERMHGVGCGGVLNWGIASSWQLYVEQGQDINGGLELRIFMSLIRRGPCQMAAVWSAVTCGRAWILFHGSLQEGDAYLKGRLYRDV